MKHILSVIVLSLILLSPSGAPYAQTDEAFNRAVTYYKQRRYEDVVRHLKEYVEKKPYASAYYLIGYSLYKLERHDEASKYFKDAYLVDPNFSPKRIEALVLEPIEKGAAVSRPPSAYLEDTRPRQPEIPPITRKEVPEKKQPPAAVKGPPPSVTPEVERKEPAPKRETVAVQRPEVKIEERKIQEPPPPPPKKRFITTKNQQAERKRPARQVVPELWEKIPDLTIIRDTMEGFPPGFAKVFFAVSLGLYIYFSLCLFLIAGKLNVPAAWTAWIPLLNLWAFVGSAYKSWLWILLLFIPGVNFFVGIYLWMSITENTGRNKWLGLLMLVPLINLIFLAVLAFSKTKTTAEITGTGAFDEFATDDLSGSVDLPDLPDDFSSIPFDESPQNP